MEIRVQIAVLVIAADPATAEAATIDVVVDKAVSAGHSIIARETVRDAVDDVRAKLESWIADPEIDVIIASAATDTQHAPAALKPLVSEAVPGFTDLFRWLAFQEIGASAMLAIAEAARCGTTFVFVLPAAPGAVATAMDKLILPQLDVHTTPKNLVAQMPRLRAFVPAPPIVADAKADQTIKTDAVPTPLTMEKTEAGHGLVPRLPAAGAHVVRKEPAVKAPPPEEKTRIISADQLESKIRQSNEHDAPTRVSVDIAKMLPRVPLGADDIDDDADIADAISPQPFARAKTPSQGKPGGKKPPTVQIPVRTKAPSGAPIAMLRKDESGRVIIPGGPREAGGEALKKDKSGPVVIPIAKMAKALKQSPPSDEAVTVHQKKPPADEATTIRATPTKKTPTPAPVPTPEPIAAAGSAPVKQAAPATPVEAPSNDADASASGSRPMTLDDSQIEEINEELAPRRRPATTPPPTPIIADIRARRREPTPLPLLAKRPDDDLPQGKFIYPTHRNRSGKRIAIFVVLAFVAAAAGIGFVHFVLQRPHTPEPNANLAVVPVVPDAAEPAPPPPPPPVVADAEIPEIDIEVPANPPPQPPPPHPHPSGTHHPIVTPIDGGGAPASLDAGAAVEEGCDEVTCVMEKYEKPCCARFKPSDDANFRPHAGVPGGLDKVMVREAMENVKPRVIACGEQNGAKGTVKLAIVVAPNGSVRSVTVTDAPQPALGTCVAAAVKAAQFEKTAKGGSFNYPFVF